MDFTFTDEQQMIRDAARSFIADHAPPAHVRAMMETERGYSPELWRRIATELGWASIAIPEQYGGLGLGIVDLVAVIELAGEALLPSPLLSTVGLAVPTLLQLGGEAQLADHLAPIAAGDVTATVALSETGGSWDLADIETRWRRDGGGFELHGSKHFVLDGASADVVLVVARAADSTGGDGIGVFAVPATTPGLTRAVLPTLDATRKQAALRLDGVRVPASASLGAAGAAAAGVDTAVQLGTLCLAAEQTGGAARCLDATVAYSKERIQFGRPIGSFQAVKHKCADMMVLVESSRSAVYAGACIAQEVLAGHAPADELARAASLAKAYASRAFFHCAAESLQLHGGVGFTWDYDVHLYLKRARAAAGYLGYSNSHRERIARSLGL